MRKFMWMSVLFATVALASAQSNQPQKIEVGDALVNGSALEPYTNQWQVSVTTPEGKRNPDAALWTDRLETVQIAGRDLLQRTQVASYKKAGEVVVTTTTTNIFDPKTMAPVSRFFKRHMEKTGADDTTSIKFMDGQLHFQHAADGKTESQEVRLETPAFDFYGGLYGLLLSTLPLKPGFSATLPSVDENGPTESWFSFKVTGEEQADAGPQGKVKTYVVEGDSNIGPLKFWISKQAPYIIRFEFTMKNGLFWTYQMI